MICGAIVTGPVIGPRLQQLRSAAAVAGQVVDRPHALAVQQEQQQQQQLLQLQQAVAVEHCSDRHTSVSGAGGDAGLSRSQLQSTSTSSSRNSSLSSRVDHGAQPLPIKHRAWRRHHHAAAGTVSAQHGALQQQQQQQQHEEHSAVQPTVHPVGPQQPCPVPSCVLQQPLLVRQPQHEQQRVQQTPSAQMLPSASHDVQLEQQVASVLPALPPLLPQQLPQRLQPQAGAPVDPSALCISDRVKLLTSNAAARRTGSRRSQSSKVDLMAVLQHCSSASLSNAATSSIISHVKSKKIGAAPETLGPFLAAYQRMAGAYGEAVVLKWLQKAPPIIRAEPEVPGRLHQLQLLLGDSAPLPEALALTKRCPQVLQVSKDLLLLRLQQLCSLLGRDPALEGRTLLVAAPALLAMQPHTLAVKLNALRALAATHTSWSEAHRSCPIKTLAILLTYSLERQLRLHYLAAHGLQDKIQMNTAMAWGKRDWLKAYPDFDSWCATYKHLQQHQPRLQLLLTQEEA